MAAITSTDKQKNKGQVFTPEYMVNAMLDWCGYRGMDILFKHVTDNSCGDGAFLVQVVHRYIQAAQEEHLSPVVIKRHLQTYIHGMDNDPEAVTACKSRLDEVARHYGITKVRWRIYRMDSLACKLYDNMMDFVVGNPPYVRIHNMEGITHELMQDCSFTDKGMTDLYLAFFDLSFRTLKKGGQLCYITPVSWLYSKAAQKFRQFILQNRNLLELVDMGHYQVFNGVSTYTIVSRFVKDRTAEDFLYSVFQPETRKKGEGYRLTLDEACIDSIFYLSDRETLTLVRRIFNAPCVEGIKVRNGFATLADKVFINVDIPDSPFTIQTVKASTGGWSRCLFPYHADGTPLSYEELAAYPAISNYFHAYKAQLQKRDIREGEWWLYGRTQALTCVRQAKLSINNLVRTVEDLKIVLAPEGTGVYSGYYITASSPDMLHTIDQILKTSDFINYVKALKKYHLHHKVDTSTK